METKCSNTRTHGGHFTFKPQQSLSYLTSCPNSLLGILVTAYAMGMDLIFQLHYIGLVMAWNIIRSGFKFLLIISLTVEFWGMKSHTTVYKERSLLDAFYSAAA